MEYYGTETYDLSEHRNEIADNLYTLSRQVQESNVALATVLEEVSTWLNLLNLEQGDAQQALTDLEVTVSGLKQHLGFEEAQTNAHPLEVDEEDKPGA